MATVLAIPLLGIGAAVAAVGVLVTTIPKIWEATGSETDQVDSIEATHAPSMRARARPLFGQDGRAQLVRIMNLSRARGGLKARLLLEAELREARSRESLAHWKPLRDLEEVLRTDGSVLRVIRE